MKPNSFPRQNFGWYFFRCYSHGSIISECQGRLVYRMGLGDTHKLEVTITTRKGHTRRVETSDLINTSRSCLFICVQFYVHFFFIERTTVVDWKTASFFNDSFVSCLIKKKKKETRKLNETKYNTETLLLFKQDKSAFFFISRNNKPVLGIYCNRFRLYHFFLPVSFCCFKHIHKNTSVLPNTNINNPATEKGLFQSVLKFDRIGFLVENQFR